MKDIYYLFSSISFLQFYIPIVIEANKNGYNNSFILKKQLDCKKYSCPYSMVNNNILMNYTSKYDITILHSTKINLKEIKGTVFMIDGDIYGAAARTLLNNSLLNKLNKENTIRISLPEHINFIHIYHHYIKNVNYCFFCNKNILNQKIELSDKEKKMCNPDSFNKKFVDFSKSFKNDKNIFLGNTKFDNIASINEILRKFSLDKNQKYCLFMFPKVINNVDESSIIGVYSHLHKLNYKVIVKTRPKNEVKENLRGDIYVSSDIYPNESLELMKISNLCIISSSSAIDETIFSSIPCIDIVSDVRSWGRNDYMKDSKVYYKLYEWNISFNNFNDIIKNLELKNSKYFGVLKQKYLFTHNNSAKKYIEFIETL